MHPGGEDKDGAPCERGTHGEIGAGSVWAITRRELRLSKSLTMRRAFKHSARAASIPALERDGVEVERDFHEEQVYTGFSQMIHA